MGNLTKILKKSLSEYQFFLSNPRDMRVLLITNMIYAFVLPVVDIFVSAYIMRFTNNDFTLVAYYQLAIYTGIPITFLLNGFLLNKIKITNLYSFGMLLSGISMLFMMTLDNLDFVGVVLAGFIMGASFGFFWANRDFLALDTTNDKNRNYYYGLETFFFTITSIIIPLLVGWFIISSKTMGWFGENRAYQFITLGVFILTIISSIAIHKEKFRNPKQKKFLHFRFDKLWHKMQFLAVLKGLAQGYLVTAPAILIMYLIGDEGSLGTIQAISGVITAVVLYLLGRFSKPQHRIYIFTVGLILFVAGTLANAIMFSATGVMVFMLAMVLFRPLHDIAYFPIQMRVIDVLSKKENRNEFAYIFNHEFGLFVGRVIGLVLFLMLTHYISEIFALKYSLLIIALLQLISIPVARVIIKHTSKEERKKENTRVKTEDVSRKLVGEPAV